MCIAENGLILSWFIVFRNGHGSAVMMNKWKSGESNRLTPLAESSSDSKRRRTSN